MSGRVLRMEGRRRVPRIIHWFRGDLRLRDNTALCDGARRADEIAVLYVLDDRLWASDATGDPRRRFLLDCLSRLASDLAKRGHALIVRRGDPCEVLPRLALELRVAEVVANRDTSPYARARDGAVASALAARGVALTLHKDRVVYEAGEVRTREGGLYSVYTPYRRAWLERFHSERPLPQPAPRLPRALIAPSDPLPAPASAGEGANAPALPKGGEAAARRRLRTFLARGVADYATCRDRPDQDGTSRLSAYLRFGAISVRECIAQAHEAAHADAACADGVSRWVDELIWREFYAAILEAHPRVLRGAFRPEMARVAWNDDPVGFVAWCEGRTGYPIVDAAMRQLLGCGWAHNRARMLAASFLSKDLLVDWRQGERHFYRHLVDGDPASNNGGWQWAASTGTDAQPYFRIFNPTTQGERLDPDGVYVKRWVPELAALPSKLVHRPWEAPMLAPDYPPPIVDHAQRRVLALERFTAAREGRV